MELRTGAYPTAFFKSDIATGNTTPPMDDPKAMIPKAVTRLLLNQCAMTLITGPNMKPHDIYGPDPVNNRRSALASIHKTDTNAKTLTEKEMPVLVTFSNEKCAEDKNNGGNDQGDTKVADIE
jgi:hypothetical protein